MISDKCKSSSKKNMDEPAFNNIPKRTKCFGTLPRAHQFIISVLMILALISAKFKPSEAYVITIDAGFENECFHERVPVGTKLGYSFEVIEGGFFDIDVEIKDPSNVILHQEERASSGKFTIEASIEGDYKICYHNKRPSFAPKVIMFDIDKSAPQNRQETGSTGSTPSSTSADGKDDSDVVKLARMVDQLMMTTISARHDVRYLNARDRVHRKLNERTNSTIMYWSSLEFILLLAVSIGQVVYVKRFFEIRRKA